MAVTDQQFERLQDRVRKLEEKLAEINRPDGTIILSSPQKIIISVGGSRITLEENGITIESPIVLNLQASQVVHSASSMTMNAPFVSMSGTIRCNTIIATNVIASNYTPGAGNVW